MPQGELGVIASVATAKAMKPLVWPAACSDTLDSFHSAVEKFGELVRMVEIRTYCASEHSELTTAVPIAQRSAHVPTG